MPYKVHTYSSLPDEDVRVKLKSLHHRIFEGEFKLEQKLRDKRNILIQLITHEDNAIAYKVGYELDSDVFYSWLGGVDPAHRHQGLAQQLMTEQHELLKEKGYTVVQTKTMNRWRGMLLLNIKNGFDVKSTYTDERGNHKIVLEKCLNG